MPAGWSSAAAISAWSSLPGRAVGRRGEAEERDDRDRGGRGDARRPRDRPPRDPLPLGQLHGHGDPLEGRGADRRRDVADARVVDATRVAAGEVGVDEEPLEVRERVVEAHREELPGAFAFQGPNVVHHWVRRYADARS